jgi:hypothetical protein
MPFTTASIRPSKAGHERFGMAEIKRIKIRKEVRQYMAYGILLILT